MRWSIALLLVLGVVAAVCAALLVVSLKSDGSGAVAPTPTNGSSNGEGSYVVAAKDLEPRTLVTEDAVEIVKTPSTRAVPSESLTQTAGVVGKVLRVSLKKGQMFTTECFASGGVVLAGTLKPGMRAVSVPLADSGGIDNLLYPGCVVDVLCSMQLKDEAGLGDQPVAVTLLQGVYALAVGDEVVGAPVPIDDGKTAPRRAPRTTVTLLVDAKQAEMLYLARQRGSVSIALRNPTDKPEGATEGTRLAHLSPIFAQAESTMIERLRARQKEEAEALKRERVKIENEMEKARFDIERQRKDMEIDLVNYQKRQREAELAKNQIVKPQWETVVLRGGVAEVKKFDVPEGKK